MSRLSSPTRFFWIRHPIVRGYEHVLYGDADVPSDVSDAQSFQWLVDTLEHADVLVTSTLLRTHQAADALRQQGLTVERQIETAALKEQHFGSWQLQPYANLPIPSPYWAARSWIQPENGESFLQVTARVATEIMNLAQQYAGKRLVVISHYGPIRAALALALGLSAEQASAYQIDNLSLTELSLHPVPNAEPIWWVNSVNRRS